MASDTFRVEVITGRGVELQREARSVTLISEVGEIGFLPQHCDYVGNLGAGVMQIEDQAGKKEAVVISGGFCSFTNNVLLVLADKIDLPGAVSRDEIQSRKVELQAALSELNVVDPKWAAVRLELDRYQALENFSADGR